MYVKMFAPPVLAEDSTSCRTATTDNMDPGDNFSASKSAGTLSCAVDAEAVLSRKIYTKKYMIVNCCLGLE